MKSLIVIPAYNEVENLPKIVPLIQRQVHCDVLIVNDNSSDDTVKALQQLGVKYLNLPLRLGAWGATQAGIRYANRNGHARVITMDADGQHDPQDIERLLESMQAHQANVVIGTDTQRLSALKKFAWRFFKSITRLKIEDLTSGFRVYDRRAIELLSTPSASLLDYQDVGVLLLIKRAGLSVTEVPVKMLHRQDGKSRVFYSWWVVFKYMLQTTTLCIAKLEPRKSSK